MNQYLLTYIYGFKTGHNILSDKNTKNLYTQKINAQFMNDTFKNDTNDLHIINDLFETAEANVPLWINENILIEDKNARDIFMCGYFDYCGLMSLDNEDISTNYISMYFLDAKILDYIEQHFIIENNLIVIKGCNIIEFLDTIYKNSKYHKMQNMYYYTLLLNSSITVYTKTLEFYKKNSNAIAPSKNRITDSGFDLYIIEKISQKNNLYMYDTGIIVQPTYGIYFDMVPRSSIIKKGYMLANSVGIIDQSFRGTVKVALLKIDPDAEELTLPLKIVQLIPRQVIQMKIKELFSENELISTVRGYGEYGSTGN